MNIDILKALADPSRLALMRVLSECEHCACILPRMVKKTQPTVSAHLKVLHEAGLVRMRKDGTKRIYSLTPLGKRVMYSIRKW